MYVKLNNTRFLFKTVKLILMLSSRFDYW